MLQAINMQQTPQHAASHLQLWHGFTNMPVLCQCFASICLLPLLRVVGLPLLRVVGLPVVVGLRSVVVSCVENAVA